MVALWRSKFTKFYTVTESFCLPVTILRIFPLPPTKVDEKNTEEDPDAPDNDNDDEEKGDDDSKLTKKSNKEIGPDPVSTAETKEDISPVTEKKSLQQIYEDILCYVSFFILFLLSSW